MATKKRRSYELDTDMLVDLHRSGLDEADVATMQLEYRAQAPEGITPSAAGYIIPYFDIRGKRVPFYRYRYLEDTRSGFEKLSGIKQRRYTQPPGTVPQVYWPPYIPWHEYIKDAEAAIIITEGEKKAARVTKAGLPCLGLGGVWSFQNAAKNEALLPALRDVEWNGREVFIIYDSDAADKLQIQQAEFRLARRLVTLGSVVYIVRLDAAEDGSKRGLDDFVQSHGIEALREVCGNAVPFSESVALHEMNTEVAYVKDPGIVYVLNSGQLVDPSDFKAHRFADKLFTKITPGAQGPRLEEKSAAAEWLKWPGRNAVERLEFEPGQPMVTHTGALNLWQGWPYEPRSGPVDKWDRMLDHIFQGDKVCRHWFEQWCAYPFQNPGAKLFSAVAIWGRMTGTGKSALGYTLGGLYGEAFSEIGDHEIEKSDFNSWAKNKQFVLGDDITGNNNRRVANDLKRMVTRERLQINIKHLPEYFTRDCINYIFTSNSPDAFLIDENDRRFFIHEVINKPLPHEFYTGYLEWRKSDLGRRALMYHFINHVDCTGFNPGAAAPMTQAKQEMIAMGRTDLEAWLAGVRNDPGGICRKFGECDLVTIAELMAAYDPQGQHRVTAVTFSRKLKELGVQRCDPRDKEPGAQIRVGPNSELVRLYALRNSVKWVNATTIQLRNHYEDCRRLIKAGKKY